MKLNTVLFLSTEDAPARLLKLLKKGNTAMTLIVGAEITTLHCALDSEDGYYLCVKIPHPVPGHPKCIAKILIPHASVLMVVQSDWRQPLGF